MTRFVTPTDSVEPTEAERARTALESYQRERAAVEQKLAQLRRIDPQTQYVVPTHNPLGLTPAYQLGPTAADLIAGAEQNLAEVDRWSRHWDGPRYNPRCPDCRERGSACDVALSRKAAA
jgi:hypothetical protein